MQYEVDTPEEYFEALEDDWRKDKLLKIRQFILQNGPELNEGIQYKMLCYGDESFNLFHLNAQKSYVSVYVGNVEKIENAKHLLNGLDYGKGCVRIKKSVKLEDSGIEDFLKKTIETWKAGKDTSC
ncbi:iron chaperone [Alkalihalobacillus sp. R86527]|uniref:iron chaperone n=1 Tax=Alkalihalobacillus sp. R86527 TaxID=3093863 RepID=UPI00366F4F17